MDINVGKDASKLYLTIYGLFQALILQQDASRHLCEALNIPFEVNPLLDIRDIRNSAVGHPTKRDRGKPATHSFISRSSMSKKGFQLHSYTRNGDGTKKYISLDELIGKQLECLSEKLGAVAERL